MSNPIDLSSERILAFERGTVRSAELLLLIAVANNTRQVDFEKRGRFIYLIGDEYELPPLPADLAGRSINHLRMLFGIDHPNKTGSLICRLNGNTADLAFELLRQDDSRAFARLTIEGSTIDLQDAQAIVRAYFESGRSELPFFERLRIRFIEWWAGDDIYRLYDIPKPAKFDV